MKQVVLNNLKNIWGWKTNRKIIVFSVDDYGNVRIDSKEARRKMDEAGLKVSSRFDAYDTLETKEDLEMLYDTLTSVKDKNGRYVVFTPFALPCNIDFEKMKNENYQTYHYELLPTTYNKLSSENVAAYEGTWNLWKEGISKGLLIPQFHGREHLNLKVFEEKIFQKDFEVMTALKNRSYTSISNSGYSTIKYTAAFDFWNFSENAKISEILNDGLQQFRKVYGFSASHFMPPSSTIHKSHFLELKENGISYIDTGLIQRQHEGLGKYSKSFNFTGKKLSSNQINIVRNVVFEPTSNVSSIAIALKQIESAFFWNRPAVISSHRVNFCGHIDPNNRSVGIKALKDLLDQITIRWPNVEFMSANELGFEILKTINDE